MLRQILINEVGFCKHEHMLTVSRNNCVASGGIFFEIFLALKHMQVNFLFLRFHNIKYNVHYPTSTYHSNSTSIPNLNPKPNFEVPGVNTNKQTNKTNQSGNCVVTDNAAATPNDQGRASPNINPKRRIFGGLHRLIF